ncbi:MAG: hypothetical protein HOC91_18685, partial [Nitrospinaceae bacterium]|nr:hypothetical protein [Nitrospinaceae bacterium]
MADNNDLPKGPELSPEESAQLKKTGARSRGQRIFVLMLLIALGIGAVKGASIWSKNYWSFESTDNAYVKATV